MEAAELLETADLVEATNNMVEATGLVQATDLVEEVERVQAPEKAETAGILARVVEREVEAKRGAMDPKNAPRGVQPASLRALPIPDGVPELPRQLTPGRLTEATHRCTLSFLPRSLS